jgi:flagellar basal-body rod modification protein FlgD
MTYVSSASSSTAAGDTQALQGTGKAATGEDFMTLLLTQLTHQNPLEPMKDGEMMAQYAQLNSVQELQKISASMTTLTSSNQIGYAASMIGKVATVAKDDGTSLTGTVTAVTIESGKVFLQIGTEKAPLTNVTEIKGS